MIGLQHPECLTRSIIEDDDAMDGCCINKKKIREKKEKGVSKGLGKLKMRMKFLLWLKEWKREFASIMSLNS